jgi:7-cyano-7-deazaguanine synthase
MKTIVIWSGGLDSTVLVRHLLQQGLEVHALTFDYGQRHRKEIEAAQLIRARQAHRSIVTHTIERLHLPGQSALQDQAVDVPDGHYEDETMKSTVVPGRNLVMLAHALAHAAAKEAQAVAFAAHAGDHAIYPDCRDKFSWAMKAVAVAYHYEPVQLLSPFVTLTKADIVLMGAKLGVPFELTWSCYKGGELHCGKCGTCVERREAFELAGVPDPTTYA